MHFIRNEVKRQQPSVYLTIISIIQSFALGFLLTSVKDTPPQLLSTWLQVIVVFQALVLCWHVNIGNAIALPVVVGLSDSYIPFVFAVPQFFMIAAIGKLNLSAWFYGLAGYSLVAFWAYVDLYRKVALEPENAERLGVLRWFPRFNKVYTITAASLFASIGYYLSGHHVTETVASVGLIFINVIFIIFTCVHNYFWKLLTARSESADISRTVDQGDAAERSVILAPDEHRDVYPLVTSRKDETLQSVKTL